MFLRLLISILVLFTCGLPLACVLAELRTPAAWNVWREGERLAELAQATFLLVVLTLLFVLPLGTVLAVLLYRTNLPGRSVWRMLVLLGLFTPLPLVISAWQAVWGTKAQPWNQGILWAALVHAATALPWVIWLVGLGLTRVERELEEEALTMASPWCVLWRMTLPRSALAIHWAVLWVVLQTSGEIAVTDFALVRTFAEEVYTQYVVGGPDALARAVVLSLPCTLLVAGWCQRVLRRSVQAITLTRWYIEPRHIDLGRWRWLFAGIVAGLVGVIVVTPLVSLVAQAGGRHSGHWSVSRFRVEMSRAIDLQTAMVLDSVMCCFIAGVLTTCLACLACWQSLQRRWLQGGLLLLVVLLWSFPAPVLGFGLKESINRLMDLEDVLLAFTDARPLRGLLYEWSTPVPTIWAYCLRFFPYAVALLWPALQAIPRDRFEMVRVDGARMWGEFRHVVWPGVRNTCLLAVVAVMALAVGELSTSKLVQVPGRQTFVQELFNQMHYGVASTTAALALVQCGLVLFIGGGGWAVVRMLPSRATHAKQTA